MQAYRVETILPEDGRLTLSDLPFREGDRVEVIVLAEVALPITAVRYPLRGKVLHFDDPTSPVAEGEWEATN